MDELIQKFADFLNYFAGWFDQNIASGLMDFFKALGSIFIKILEFFIDIIRWLIERI